MLGLMKDLSPSRLGQDFRDWEVGNNIPERTEAARKYPDVHG